MKGRSSRGGDLWTAPLLAISASTAVSSLGDGVALVGLPLLAASLDRSPIVIALVMVAQRAPWVFSLVTGTITDRVRLRRYVGVVEASRMVLVALLGLAVAGHFHPLAAVYVVAAGLGTFDSAFFAATGRMVTGVVAPARLGQANGYLYAIQMGAEGVAGQALGGLLAAIALAIPFLFDGATFGLSALVLVGAAVRPVAGSDDIPAGSIAAGMREGWRWFADHAGLRAASVYVAALAFCQSMVMGVLVLWALHVLHLSRAGYGLLLGATTFGMVLGALLSGRAVDRFGTGPMLVAAGGLAALTYAVAGATRMAALAGAFLFLEQAAVASGSVANQAMRQLVIPRDMIGRVANITRSLIYGAVPLGALVGGVLASRSNLRVPFFVAGALQLLFVLAMAPRLIRHFPAAGRAAASAEVTPQP